MANKRFYQFMFSKIPMLTMIQGQVTFGAAGAVSSVSGNGVLGVTLLGTGLYVIQLEDNYNAFMGADFRPMSGVTGANIADGSFVVGTQYQITAVGTTDFNAIGLDAGLTAAVGQVFVATGVGGAGTGTAKVVAPVGVAQVEVPQFAASMLAPSIMGQGALIPMNTMDYAGALVAPANGGVIEFNLMLRNSSVQY